MAIALAFGNPVDRLLVVGLASSLGAGNTHPDSSRPATHSLSLKDALPLAEPAKPQEHFVALV